MTGIKQKVFISFLLFFLSGPFGRVVTGEEAPAENQPQKILFSISGFQVEGSEILSPEKINEIVTLFEGDKKEMEDIEKTRAALERAYHEAGYPTILVVVPEQTLDNGIVKMTVIEGRLGKVEVTGNRYFSTHRILNKLPSIRSGALLYEPQVAKEMNQVNSNPDLVVTPVLVTGSEPGTVDLNLQAKDSLPLHGTLELNNRQTPNTPRFRLNGSLQYTNLFDRDHTLTLNTTQSPDKLGKVQMYGLSYSAPIGAPEHLLVVYATRADNSSINSALLANQGGGDVNIVGNTTLFGTRYLFPFSGLNRASTISHQFALALEYKAQGENKAEFPDGTDILYTNPVNYLPFSITYTGSKDDNLGTLKITVTAKGNRAGIVRGGGQTDFGGDFSNPDPYYQIQHPGNRRGSTGNFAIFQAGSEILRYLPKGFSLSLKGELQFASEPLIPAEEFFAGGVDSVRGYRENEVLGDNGFRGSLEVISPPLPATIAEKAKGIIHLTAFLDGATLFSKEVLPGEVDHFELSGAGIGFHFKASELFEVSIDQAWPLESGVVTQKGDPYTHVSVKAGF